MAKTVIPSKNGSSSKTTNEENPTTQSPARGPARPEVGLALAGGAPGGAIYEIGALHALNEAIDGLELVDCGAYVGVSAGAFLASCLANGLSTAKQCRAIVKHEPGEHPFVPENFFRPALKELSHRVYKVPKLLWKGLGDYASGREERLLAALTVVGRALPVGVFANEPIADYVQRIFSLEGRTDDFRELDRRLTVVATDLESGESMRFGHGGRKHVPISKAVQASTALPGLYPPVQIDGRHYVDGILLKTMHASVALDAGAKLVFCINPLVPVDTRKAVQTNEIKGGKVVRRGLVSVLSQTVRTMIYSRMHLGLRAYEALYPDADLILLEPRREDHEDFFSNLFSFSSRWRICEHAFDVTRQTLLSRKDELIPILERHGLGLNVEFLEDKTLDVWTSVGLPELSSAGGAEPEAATRPGVMKWRREAGKERPDGRHPTEESPTHAELMDDLTSTLDRIERLVEQRAGA